MTSGNDLQRYRRVLTEMVKSCDCSNRPIDEIPRCADRGEQAVVNHARYVEDVDEEIHWAICDAARRALRRMDRGEFGRCLECREMLSPSRLDAVPWAGLCLRCQLWYETRGVLRRAA